MKSDTHVLGYIIDDCAFCYRCALEMPWVYYGAYGQKPITAVDIDNNPSMNTCERCDTALLPYEVLLWSDDASAIVAPGLHTEHAAHKAARDYIDRYHLAPRVVLLVDHMLVIDIAQHLTRPTA